MPDNQLTIKLSFVAFVSLCGNLRSLGFLLLAFRVFRVFCGLSVGNQNYTIFCTFSKRLTFVMQSCPLDYEWKTKEYMGRPLLMTKGFLRKARLLSMRVRCYFGFALLFLVMADAKAPMLLRSCPQPAFV